MWSHFHFTLPLCSQRNWSQLWFPLAEHSGLHSLRLLQHRTLLDWQCSGICKPESKSKCSSKHYFQEEYKDKHPQGVIPVKANDVFFPIHAVFACAVTIVQCCIYEVNVNLLLNTNILQTSQSILGSDSMMKSDCSLTLWVLFKCSLRAFSALLVLSECSLIAI